MKYRLLGKTNLKVSEIGFGTWGLGGQAYGPTSESDSLRSLEVALDQGINFFDTANIYGMGKSEELLAKAFAPHRKKVILATKVGMVDDTGKLDWRKPSLEASLLGSLGRLNTDYVDLVQLHGPEIGNLEDAVEAMESFQAKGIVRHWGISLTSPKDGIEFLNKCRPSAIQVNFNVLDQRCLDLNLFELCQKQNVGVIARTPLIYGLLSQNIDQTSLASQDHRKRFSKAQWDLWNQTRDELGINTIVALRFCLSFQEVGTVIPGMLLESQVLENIRASDAGPLTNHELKKLRDVYLQTSFKV